MDGIVRTIDFALARCKHLEWKNRLIAALDGRPGLTEEEAACHTDCDLGKWLYSPELQKQGNLASMQELHQAHVQAHAIAARVLQMKDAGNIIGAYKEFGKLDQVSDRILTLLGEVERQV